MAKSTLTKSNLKIIVKECLLEILEEGISLSSYEINERSNKGNHKTAKRSRLTNSRQPSNNPSSKSDTIKNKNFESNIERVANSLTSDPVLSSILTDTAMTTLQEQVERQGPGGVLMPAAGSGDYADRVAAQSAPEDLFSDSAGKWAQLAFSDVVEKQ